MQQTQVSHDIPATIDKLMGWKVGKAERLARQRRLPHLILPDGSIRFDRSEIESLIVHVPSIDGGPKC